MKNFLAAKWENLIMANYAIDPKILKPYLLKGTELDFFEGKTYVSLVGFMFINTKIFGLPAIGLGTFEEVNLRFYVTRKEGNMTKRGVVFINETIPNKIVAWVANYLYKEHYIAIPTKHKWDITPEKKAISYSWKMKKDWNNITVNALPSKHSMAKGSIEEFIFEHYFGYTKVSDTETIEYKINHPSWQVNKVLDSKIICNFEEMYGKDFGFLSTEKPDSIMLAEGSDIAVKWKRNRLKF
jgi:uncharacterized protein YqjF (DUF2071 family)